jgi:hypothetical protein
VRLNQHAEPHGLLQGWLFNYALATPGVLSAPNATIRLGPDDVVQPDCLLRILPECGGRARVNAQGYLEGGPEFVAEVAASTASIDSREKLASYRRAGVLEYLVWRTMDGQFDWWILEEDEYRPLSAETEGIVRSRIFPGLWLDTAALLAGNGAKLVAILQKGLQSTERAAFVAQRSCK